MGASSGSHRHHLSLIAEAGRIRSLADFDWARHVNTQCFWYEPLLPQNQPGARRVDDRPVLSGIVHMLKHGGRWQDCPRLYGPPTTIYNRYHRWSQRGIWTRMLAALVQASQVA